MMGHGANARDACVCVHGGVCVKPLYSVSIVMQRVREGISSCEH